MRGVRGLRLSLPPALRYREFRAYWMANLVSVGGTQMFWFAQLWIVHDLTGSPLYLGYLGLAQAAPTILLLMAGGVLADRVDRKRIFMSTQLVGGSLIIVMGLLTVLNLIEVWHVIAVAFLTGIVNALDWPTRQSLFPQLVDRSVMTSAVALDSSVWWGMGIVAPALAGFLIGAAGMSSTFFLAGAGLLVMALVVARLDVPGVKLRERRSALQDTAEGLRFIKRHSIFGFLLGMIFFNSLFGSAYTRLMPVFAVDILEVGAQGQGLLMSAAGVGALMMTLRLAAVGSTPRLGMQVIGGAAMFGLAIVAFALTAEFVGSFYLALAIIFTMGVFQALYMISVTTTLQVMVPEDIRGRVMGIHTIVYGITPLSGMQAGAMALYIGTPFAVAIGGFLVMGFALGPAMLNPRVRNLGRLLQAVERAAPVGPPAPAGTNG